MAIVLYRAHEDNEFVRRGLAKLRAELPHLEIVLLVYRNEAPERVGLFADAYIVTEQDLRALPYPHDLATFDPDDYHNGIFDLPILKFFRDHPDHDFYWVIEYDVFYSGDWRDLFETLSADPADLLGTVIDRKADCLDWPHWPSLKINDEPPPPEHCIKAFIPFTRASRAALRAIDELYMSGLAGHGEATWPTACSLRNLVIADIGDHGPFTPADWRGKHYTPFSDPLHPGTFIFRPVYTREHVDQAGLPPLLWHPVKS